MHQCTRYSAEFTGVALVSVLLVGGPQEGVAGRALDVGLLPGFIGETMGESSGSHPRSSSSSNSGKHEQQSIRPISIFG